MRTEAAIKHFGSRAALAEALGISSQATYKWSEEVPLLRAYQLERLTGGVLKVGARQKRDG